MDISASIVMTILLHNVEYLLADESENEHLQSLFLVLLFYFFYLMFNFILYPSINVVLTVIGYWNPLFFHIRQV
jgi:hypothetical protein